MTTNKPTVIAWAPSLDLAKLSLSGGGRNGVGCILTDGPTPHGNDAAMVRLADYEALQADRDQQYDMKVRAREQRDAVTAQLKALQAECEKLRKDAERYRKLRSTTWDASPLCVVVDPKHSVQLGSDCPSHKRLDDIVDNLHVTTP